MAREHIPFLVDVKPLVESKLKAWGLLANRYPDASISGVYQSIGISGKGEHRISPQEKWALRYANELKHAEIVDKVLHRLSKEQKELVRLRYKKHLTWEKIAKKLNVGRRTVFEMRDGILTIIAYECDLLKDE